MNSFLAKIYSFKFFDDLILIYPLYVVMFTDFHITPIQISILLAAWAGTSLLLEIPSGVLADKYSRKNILFIGQIIRTIGYALWMIFPNFWGFLVGFIFWGIESAFASGTFEALVYDELKSNQQEKKYAKIIGITNTLTFVAIFLASVLSSIVIPFGYQLVLLFSCLGTIISGLIIFTLPEVKKFESTHEKEYLILLKQGFKNAFKDSHVVHLMIFLSLAFALGGALDEYWTLFANGAGLNLEKLGIFLALMSLAQGLSSYFAHKFEHFSNRFFYILFLLCGIFLILSAYWYSVPALGFLILFSLIFTVIHIVFGARFQHSIPTETRATVSSVNGFMVELGVIIVYFTVGSISQISSLRDVFGVYGVIIVIIGVIYFLTEKARSNIKSIK